ncbi:MAG TPA: cupin domain-containing protein [bacterium]|nr:cupin domain-containing protein [bacterium]
MKVSSSEAREKHPDNSTIIWEYNLPTKNIGLATGKINGRHPESGWIKNTQCEIVYYCLSGQGTVTIEDEPFELKAGDVLFIEQNKKYFIEGQDLSICLPSSPAWTPEQVQSF